VFILTLRLIILNNSQEQPEWARHVLSFLMVWVVCVCVCVWAFACVSAFRLEKMKVKKGLGLEIGDSWSVLDLSLHWRGRE
jgi:heme/copper-type cytochrome/quinol oxidase subunit 2